MNRSHPRVGLIPSCSSLVPESKTTVHLPTGCKLGGERDQRDQKDVIFFRAKDATRGLLALFANYTRPVTCHSRGEIRKPKHLGPVTVFERRFQLFQDTHGDERRLRIQLFGPR